jgi:hypothetical protein
MQADTIVPELGNPIALDRYGYGGNNPIRFIDPTGHFTEAAIWRYLVQQYGDSAYRYWVRWKNDEEWWDMLRNAKAGDILFVGPGNVTNDNIFLTFQGEGDTILEGVVRTDGNGNPITDCDWTCEIELSNIQQGIAIKRGENDFGRWQIDKEIIWGGFIRYQNGTPSFYTRSKFNKIDKTTPKGVRDLMGFTIGIVEGSLSYIGGLSGIKAMIFGGLAKQATSGFLLDILDMEDGDVRVRIGPFYFNFNHDDFSKRYIMEHTGFNVGNRSWAK